jgi:hypothetical protein
MFTKRLLQICLFISLGTASLFAQAGIGGIAGVVRDPSGSTIPEATVVISNESKGIRRSAETTGAGVFNAAALVPASGYSVEVIKPGFSKYQAKNITVEVGGTVNLDIQLDLATATTSVNVEAAVPTVEDSKAGIADLVNQQQIDNLPINGRRADTFVLLTPGVVRDGTFGLVSFHGISAGNAFLTDGNYTTDSFYSENAGRTRISTQISEDAVQEFQVISNGYSAEFGRAMGGIINTVTRSGSNAYHGTAYEFFRNRTLDATDRYATFNPPEWRHQAGGSLGGPIKKDKLFFFSNYELIKRNFPGLNRITTSLIADPTGNVVSPANCVANAVTGPTAAQCALASAFIQKQMNVLVARTVSSDIGFTKIDYRPGERNSLTFDMNVMHWVSPHGIQTQSVLPTGAMLGNNGNSTVETRYGNADWTFIVSPKALNDFRFGWFKDRLSDPGASDLWPSTGPLYITVAGATVGAAQAYPRTYPSEQRFQFSDSLSWTAGAHSLKFGVDIDRTEDYLNQLFNSAGGYSFSSLANFAKNFSAGPGCSGKVNGVTQTVGCYTTFTQTFGNPVQDLHTTNLNLYALDSWKINAKLTLNYGVRWERTFLPQPTITNPAFPQTAVIPQTNRDVAPRISLSYGINDKTVIRAGYGLFYAPYITDGLDTLFLGNALYQTSISVSPTQAGAPLFPNVVANAASVPAGTVQVTFADKNFHNPYSSQANLAIERKLGWDTDFTASYSYTRGIGLVTSTDVNLTGPTTTATYAIDNAAGVQVNSYTTPVWTSASKINTAFSHVYDVSNGGQSWYSGLTLQLRKRMGHGFMAQVAYTYSHAIDDAQQSGASTTIAYSQSNTYNGNFIQDKGNSATDQRHRFVVNWLWNPTFTTSTSAFARYFVNGWQLSSATTLASAFYGSGSVSVSSAVTGISFLSTSTLNGLGGWNRVPFLPVNSQRIDGEEFVNARISRSIPITEKVRASLLFEAFNVFNTTYSTSINSTAYTATNGVLKPVASFGTGNSAQAFPDGTNARRMQAGVRIEF